MYIKFPRELAARWINNINCKDQINIEVLTKFRIN